MTVDKHIFCTENIETIAILLVNRFSIKLKRVVYTPNYNLNLVLLSYLYNNGITYMNSKDIIIPL